MEENGKINIDRLKAYAGDVGKVARDIEALIKSDGWQIFLALLEREKRDIKERTDYKTIEEFKAERKAIEVFDGIMEKFNEYISDASEADDLIIKITQDLSQTPNKGVLILDSLEEHGREQG